MIYKFVKRVLDILLSCIGLIVALPILGIVAVLIFIKMGSPIFFVQERVGKNNKIFKMIKFRSMAQDKDADGNLLSDEERLGSFGQLLRSTSIDELPELINVLKGDMSLIGPRPLLVEYLPRYSKEQIRRHEVKPGVTGWSQVNGRNNVSWDERFKLDVWYVDNMSVWIDIKILLLTIYAVVKREGISQQGNVTMEKFMG